MFRRNNEADTNLDAELLEDAEEVGRVVQRLQRVVCTVVRV